LRDRGNEPI